MKIAKKKFQQYFPRSCYHNNRLLCFFFNFIFNFYKSTITTRNYNIQTKKKSKYKKKLNRTETSLKRAPKTKPEYILQNKLLYNSFKYSLYFQYNFIFQIKFRGG